MNHQTHLSRGKKPYNQYQFRCIVPRDLEEHFFTKEFRISLKSSLYSHSKIISRNLYNLSQFIFREVREGYMKDITLEEVKNILRIEVRKSLLHIHHYEYGTNIFDEDKLKESISRVDKDEENLKERLKKDYKGTIDKIENEIDKILVSQNLNPNKNNVEYKGLVRKWVELKLIRQTWKRDLLNNIGKTDDEFRNELEDKWKLGLFGKDTEEIPTPKQEPSQPIVKSKNSVVSPLFSKVYPTHLDYMKENRRRLETIGETEETYKDFISIVGDKPIGEYTREDGRDFRTTLTKLPRNRKRVKTYRDKTLEEILSMKIPNKDKISIETQTKLLSRIVSFWNYLIDVYGEYVDENVFKTKSVRKSSKKLKDRRERFTDEEIELIFDYRHYLHHIFDKKKHTSKIPYYFIPLLSLTSGCRIEELCMMRIKDIVKVGKIWVYKIREEGEYGKEETKVKSPYSERDIPFHPEIVDTLGFIRYVKYVKKLGHERVFWELNKVGNIYHKNVSRWFNEKYLVQLGIKKDKKSFHSFRHSVETTLTNQNVNPRFIDYLQGHSQKGIGGSVYLKTIEPQVLLEECVSKLNWKIDYNKLKIKW